MKFLVTYADKEGRPVPGLPARESAVVVRQYDPGRVACPPLEGTDVGDLAIELGGLAAGDGLMTRLADGWHRIETVEIRQDTAQAAEWMRDDLDAGSIAVKARRDVTRVEVVIAGMEADAVQPAPGEEADRPTHPSESVLYTRDGGWACSGCGSETMDLALFEEAGCATR